MTDGYANVLVPTDGSDLAVDALDEATTIAGLADATIHVLYVVDDAKIAELATDTGPGDISFDADVDRLFDRFEVVGEQAIADVRAAAADRGVEVVTAIREGLPRDEILTYADDTDMDLIVMATHGRSGLRRYLLGSTTERVLRRSDIPVLTVRGDTDAR